MRLRAFLAAVALCTAACSSDTLDRGSDGTWVGTITTEGNVTTVVNESGSVWGGTATLVEEISIGVESGPDEYMFGRINAVSATDDYVYVVDGQVPAVRVYDHGGTFVRNLGGEGQGPGEYTSPEALAVDQTGRVLVLAYRLGRINVYSPDGEPLDTWPFPNSRCCAWRMYPLAGEAVWAPTLQGGVADNAAQAVGPNGPYGDVSWVPEIDYQPSTYPALRGFQASAPFSAAVVWSPAPDGKLLFGSSDRYRFELHSNAGPNLVVERYWDPVPVPPEHGDWERQRAVAFQRRLDPEFMWDGAGMPDHKPALWSFVPSLTGETWAMRPGASRRLSDCAEDPIAEGHPAGNQRPCWADELIVDSFGVDGRYLGEVDLPQGFDRGPLRVFVDGRRVVAVVQDAAGTIMVKRYRLVLPGER